MASKGPFRTGDEELHSALALGDVTIGLAVPILVVILVSLVPFYTVTTGNPFSILTLKNYAEILGRG